MKTQFDSSRTIKRVGLFLLIIAIVAAPVAAQTRQFTIKNNCSETVWLAGAGTPTPVFNGSPGGLAMAPGTTVITSVPAPWVAGRFWGRRNCTFDSSGKGSCATGDCGGLLQCTHTGAGNTSLAEFTLTGTTGSDNYDVSLVDAFDFPISIQLDDPAPSHCVNPACQTDLRTLCPADQQNKDAAGNVVGCKSLCGKYSTPNYCCGGPYGVPGACNNVSWNTNFRATVVKNACPSVYGYAYDDASSDFGCHPPAAPGYIVTFCPDSSVPNANPNTNPTFTITASDNGQTVAPGNSVTYHLNVIASSTFSGTVNLGTAHMPQSCTWAAGGAASCSTAASSATFSTTSVALTPGATVPVTLTIKANASPAPILGTSNIEVIGQSGALENVWEGALTVADPTAQDYTLQVTPNTPQTIAPGGSMVYNMTLTPLNGFTGTVNFLSFGTPPGTVSFSPGSVTLSGSAQTATFTVNSSTGATKKTYYPLITTFTGNRLHDSQNALTLSTGGTPDFTISATPSSQSVVQGNSTTYTVSVGALNGFTGTVSLGASGLPSGSNASFNPASISGSGTSTLTVTTATSTPAGNYTLTITGTSGSLSHPANVTLTVTGTPPQPPSNLTASTVSSSAINLGWTPSPTSGVTYSVFRSTTSGFTPSSSNQIASGVTSTSFADSGLTCGTMYFYQVEAANAGGTSTPTNQASAATQTCVGPNLAINSGGPAVAPFAADVDFVGGGTINHANTIDLSGVTSPAPMAVYQTARTGNFTYTIPGFAPGSSQTVRLHFAETFFAAAGSRVFNVTINGTQVLTNFDIFAAAGAKNKAVIEQFTEAADSSGNYVIQFTSVVNNSLVSGIEILTSQSCAPPTTPSGLSAIAASSSQINLSWAASSSSCAVTYSVFRSTTSGFIPSSSNQVASGVTGTSFSDGGLACSTTYFYVVEAVNSGGTSASSNEVSATTPPCMGIRINSGGPAVSPFVADVDFAGGATINHANTVDLSGVTNPAPMAVYQTARVGNFTYTIPGFGAGSSHTVRLHFAETFFASAGSRTFNVTINGTQVLTNFDIFAAAGAKNKAVIKQFTENANPSGQYVITFTSVVNQSLVSGIEVQ
ncbi:MAG TPA: thaumatin family protein [Terriglobales bacterium]|jgi:hypothetical protein|nr:thaumatin family protein [Terriglobales bacterium]